MPYAIFHAIAFQDPEMLEHSLESGDSPKTPNDEGIPPLSLVASLIKKSFKERSDKGDAKRVDAMFETGRIHYTYEQ